MPLTTANPFGAAMLEAYCDEVSGAADRLLRAVRCWDLARVSAAVRPTDVRLARAGMLWGKTTVRCEDITDVLADWAVIGLHVEDLVGRLCPARLALAGAAAAVVALCDRLGRGGAVRGWEWDLAKEVLRGAAAGAGRDSR